MSTGPAPATPSRRRRILLAGIAIFTLLAVIAAVLIFRFTGSRMEPPPRTNDAIETPEQASLISVPLETDTAALSQALEKAVPRTLWTINKKVDTCIQGQRVKIFNSRLKVTPDLSCTIEGVVTRGAIRLRGEGELIVADIPIHARITARNVGGVLRETANGSALVRARVHLTLRSDWTPAASVKLAYDWTTPPGIDFLGQRITFTDQADEKLQPIVRDLERDLPKELAKLDLRGKVEQAWQQSFTSLLLNEQDPSVWMRITPQQLSYGGYSLSSNKLRLSLSMEARTETFVGPRPEDPAATPLPALQKQAQGDALRFFIPVVADYDQLEPVVHRALVKRAARPFELPGIGAVTARFGKVTVYGTTGGRIAIGLEVAAKAASSTDETVGTVWISAKPVNAANSRQVGFTDLEVRGNTNRVRSDLLVQLVNSPALSTVVAQALTQNFTDDFEKLLSKVHQAIEHKREGEFVIRADITKVETGELKAAGQGLYLPVWAEGKARVEYRPN